MTRLMRKSLLALCVVGASGAWASESPNHIQGMIDLPEVPMEARCEDGQMIVKYVTGEQTAKTEVWSEGHPLRCTNDLAEPGTLNGEPVSMSQLGDLIRAAVHQHLIIRQARLVHREDWFNGPLPRVTASSLSATLDAIGNVDVHRIGPQSAY